MNTELIVALDVPSSQDIPRIVDSLPEEITLYKVGLELFASEGPGALVPLHERGKGVFLDLKLHDIPRTVAKAVAAAGRLGVRLLTVHACGGADMLEAAADAAAALGDTRPRLVAVTVLTSLDQADLKALGVDRPIAEHARALAQLAVASGIDGVVCSAQEAAAFRQTLGPAPLIVTPGIRPAGGDVQDQKRVATPEAAVHAGATHIVVGRPILAADDPPGAARSILSEMAAAI